MNQRIFVDTNIILDLLTRRAPYYAAAARLFSAIEKGRVEACTSSLSYANLHYILRKEVGSPKAIEVLKNLRKLLPVLPVGDAVIDQALDSAFTDFEDAIQYHTALAGNITYLVTRNQKDFRTATIPVVAAAELLAHLDL